MRPFHRCLIIPVIALPMTLFTACGGSSKSDNPGGTTHEDGSTGATTSDGGGDAGQLGSGDASTPTGDGGFVEAPHIHFPTLVYGGAPEQLSPKIVSVFFPNDPLEAQLTTFGAGVTQTTWWTSVMGEYCQADGGCIGAGQTGTIINLDAGPAPEYDDNDDGGGVQLEPWITNLIASNVLPTPDDNTIFMFYMPGTTIVNSQGLYGCSYFDGYHGATANNVAYAVAMECLADDAGYPAYGVDNMTMTASHEIAESATDGLTDSNYDYGWYTDMSDPNNWAWDDAADGEIADFCSDFIGDGMDVWQLGSFQYQRIWSVKAAAAGENPCRPIPTGEVYFNAAPTAGFIEMTVGQTVIMEVDAFSDAKRANWNLEALDSTNGWATPTYVTVSWLDGGTADTSGYMPVPATILTGVNNGSKAMLSITLNSDPSSNTSVGSCNNAGTECAGEADVQIYSFDGTSILESTTDHPWNLAVMTPASAKLVGAAEPDGGVIPQLRHFDHRQNLGVPVRTAHPERGHRRSFPHLRAPHLSP